MSLARLLLELTAEMRQQLGRWTQAELELHAWAFALTSPVLGLGICCLLLAAGTSATWAVVAGILLALFWWNLTRTYLAASRPDITDGADQVDQWLPSLTMIGIFWLAGLVAAWGILLLFLAIPAVGTDDTRTRLRILQESAPELFLVSGGLALFFASGPLLRRVRTAPHRALLRLLMRDAQRVAHLQWEQAEEQLRAHYREMGRTWLERPNPVPRPSTTDEPQRTERAPR